MEPMNTAELSRRYRQMNMEDAIEASRAVVEGLNGKYKWAAI